MIEKRIDHPLSDHGLHSDILDFSVGGALQKVASQQYIPPSLDRAIREIQAAPDPSKVYLYDRALGAGEIYGPNNNGDWFGSEELRRHHDSFVKSAKLYRHHKNKGPHIGDVLASAYNERLDTVDLIISAPIDKLASDIARLDGGSVLATSMGAKLRYDICSYCGNRASRRSLYCSCLKYNILKIYPDGRQVFAINPNPKFVDISLVVIPAAPESVVLRKIASFSYLKKQALFEQTTERGVINPIIIEKTSNIHRADLLRTLHQVKGALRPDEFQAVLRKDASLIRTDMVPYVGFQRVSDKNIGGRIIDKLAGAISNIPNIMLDTTAKQQNASFLDFNEKIAYLQYRQWDRGLDKTASMEFIR